MTDASYQPAPAAQPGRPGGAYPEASQATLALILGIVGLLLFQLLSPFAWWLGGKEKKAIDAGRRDPANRGQAVGAWVLGIIGTILLILGVIITVILVIVGVAAAASGA
ncbi:MAG: hypothetical protein ACFCVG_02910 [Kineosporiaceae bacterium]